MIVTTMQADTLGPHSGMAWARVSSSTASITAACLATSVRHRC